MIRTSRWAALALLALITVGCASTQGGTAVVAASADGPAASSTPRSGPNTVPPAITVPSTISPLPTQAAIPTKPTPADPTAAKPTPADPAAAPAAGTAALEFCPDVAPSDENGIDQCLGQSLAEFWSARLDLSVDHRVVVDPAAEQVPAECRSALTTAPAFTCQVDNVVYLDPKLTTLVDGHFTEADRPYALAVVVAHEFGHVVQAQVKQPEYGASTPAASQQIEQQADCLSGVWVHQQGSAGVLDTARFAAVQRTLITAISDATEVASHGTPQERAAALTKGLQNGHQQDCALTGATAVPAA